MSRRTRLCSLIATLTLAGTMLACAGVRAPSTSASAPESSDEYLELGTYRYEKAAVTVADERYELRLDLVRFHEGREIGKIRTRVRKHERRREEVLEVGDAGGFRRLRVKFLADSSRTWVDTDERPDTATLGGREIDVIVASDGLQFKPRTGLPLTKDESSRLAGNYTLISRPTRGGGGGGQTRPYRIHVGDEIDGARVPALASTKEAKIGDARLASIDRCGADRCGTVTFRGAVSSAMGERGVARGELEGEAVVRERDGRLISIKMHGPMHFAFAASDDSGDNFEGNGELRMQMTEETP